MPEPKSAHVDTRYYEVAAPGSVAERVLVAARDRIYRDFIACCRPAEPDTLLDVGVSDVINAGANFQCIQLFLLEFSKRADLIDLSLLFSQLRLDGFLIDIQPFALDVVASRKFVGLALPAGLGLRAELRFERLDLGGLLFE